MGSLRTLGVMALVLAPAASAFAADTKAECIGAADLGQQLRDDGKYRAAKEKLLACSRPECPAVVSASCARWLKDLGDATPSIVLGAKDPAGGDLIDVRVWIDGEAVASSLDGKPLAVDPGNHKVRFERSGSATVEQSILVRAGEKTRPITVTLQPTNATTTTTTAADASAPDANARATDAPPSSTAKLVVFGSVLALAAGALGTGIYFGVASQNDADNASALRSKMSPSACVGVTTPDCSALSDAVDAQNRDATLNVAMFVASGVLAAVSLIPLLAWPKAKEPSSRPSLAWVLPSFDARGAGAALGGRF